MKYDMLAQPAEWWYQHGFECGLSATLTRKRTWPGAFGWQENQELYRQGWDDGNASRLLQEVLESDEFEVEYWKASVA